MQHNVKTCRLNVLSVSEQEVPVWKLDKGFLVRQAKVKRCIFPMLSQSL